MYKVVLRFQILKDSISINAKGGLVIIGDRFLSGKACTCCGYIKMQYDMTQYLSGLRITRIRIMKIKGVDYAAGLARFRNNADRFMKVLYKFANGPEMVEIPFDEAVLPENAAETKTRVHTLKGVAGNLAMNELFRLCAEFEKTLVAGAPDRELYDGIYREHEMIRSDILANISAEVTAEAVTRCGRNECLALLAELRQNAENYDAAACEPVVKKLRANKWADIDQGLLDSVITFIESYDFEDAVMVIDSI